MPLDSRAVAAMLASGVGKDDLILPQREASGNQKMLEIGLRAEAEVLDEVADLGAFTAAWRPGEVGRYLVIEKPVDITADNLRQRVRGTPGGESIPNWAHGVVGRHYRGLILYRVRDAYHFPQYGVVVTSNGAALHHSAEEALYGNPNLVGLPYVRVIEGNTVLEPPADIALFPRATVFCAAGGPLNYGHFLLDCLPALLAAQQHELLATHAPLIPEGLKPWHFDLLLKLVNRQQLIATTGEVIRIQDAVYASPMAHFLNAPGPILADLRSLLTEGVPVGKHSGRIYLSRLGDRKRLMVNEASLQRELVERGFEIVQPEHLSISDQIKVIAGAEVLCGAVGAAFANGLFMQKGSKVVEIQPVNYLQRFVQGMSDVLDLEWYPFFCQSPLQETRIMIQDHDRIGEFSFEVPLEEFLRFLDKALAA